LAGQSRNRTPFAMAALRTEFDKTVSKTRQLTST
jgi:hypothetical protein